MKLGLSVDEVLTTTRAVRKRLDVTRPVPRELLEQCLELALQAPNGSNRNQWRWIIVDEPEMIAAVAHQYRAAMQHVLGSDEIRRVMSSQAPGEDRILESGKALAEKIDRMPAILVPLMPGRPEGKSLFEQASMWGSILQAVWSFSLALRERGLGSVWTTVTCLREKEIFDLLGLSGEEFTHIGMLPIAYTEGTDFRKAWRKPLSEVLSYNGVGRGPA